METYISKLGDFRSVNTTSDCVRVINNHYKVGKWKRKSKFNLTMSPDGDLHVVRVFTDGKEFVTIIDIDGEVILCRNLDLSEHKPIIDKIVELGKKYYTHDYGEIWYNPWEKKLWVSGGDGGIIYDEIKTPQQLVKQMEEDGWEEFVETPYFHEKILELTSSTFEAEHSPEPYYDGEEIDEWNKDEINFIQIGYIIDLGNF
jgi:hypothetical protein